MDYRSKALNIPFDLLYLYSVYKETGLCLSTSVKDYNRGGKLDKAKWGDRQKVSFLNRPLTLSSQTRQCKGGVGTTL